MLADTVTVVRASQSREDFDWLVSVVKSPTDDQQRLKYADWLVKQQDARGALMREFVENFQAQRPLPALDGVPGPWADLTGLTILSKIAESELHSWSDQLLKYAKPALRIEVSKADFENPPATPSALGTTRVGGDADLPVNSRFPNDRDGVPFHFLSQFDLADLRQTVAGLFFPKSGLMSIFRPQADGFAFYAWESDCPHLVRLIAPGTPLARFREPTCPTDPPAPFRPGLQLVETLRPPSSCRKWPGVTLTDDQIDRFDPVDPANPLLREAYLLLGHAVHGNIGQEPLADRPDWVQLMLVPYFEGPDYGVTDMSLSYHLPAADLREGRFDRLETSFG